MEVPIAILLGETEVYIYDWPTARRRFKTKSESLHLQSEDGRKLEIANKINFKARRDTGPCFSVQKYTLNVKGRGRVTLL